MDHFRLPAITMVAGATPRVDFQITDYFCMSVDPEEVVGYLSVSPYINLADAPLFSIASTGLDEDGVLSFVIDSDKIQRTYDTSIFYISFANELSSRMGLSEEEQLSIFRAQVATMDKPEKVKEGIVRGKLNKLYSEVCFLNQPFVKDDTMSVEKKMAEVAKAAGGKLEIVSYSFYQAGVDA